jgi:hypothetical protein
MHSTIKVVVFTSNNALQLTVPEEDSHIYENKENAVINPTLAHVGTLPPHHWKLVDGRVTGMNVAEKLIRNMHLNRHGAQNIPILIAKEKPSKIKGYFKKLLS